MSSASDRIILPFYSRREWHIAALLFVSYVTIYLAAAAVIPTGTGLRPAIAIAVALVALFFGGLRLWPVVSLAALVACILSGDSYLLWAAVPVSVTIQTTLGAFLLRRARLDPIFRRYSDMFTLTVTILLISSILPTAVLLVNAIQSTPFTVATWGRYYVASTFCLLILTPLLLRWCTKPRFTRTAIGTFELVAVFGALIALAAALFIYRIPSVAGISLIYPLLIPLFWIALRLRPRFVTLSLLIVSVFAIGSTIAYGDPETLSQQLFGMEMFLIVLATIFLTITSIEEDRRVNTTLMLTQMAALENAVARISSESRAKNDFIAILAHELRNPLAPVVSAIELMRLNTSLGKDETETLDMMADRMDTVRRLLDDLLDISRISEGKMTLKSETVDIAFVIDRAIISTEHYRIEDHQKLALKQPDVVLCTTGDAVRLEQVFTNLLANASKFSHSGGAIGLSVREDFGMIEVEISDNGAGLDESEIGTIFLPFQQGESGTRSMKGLGIGLALVRNFVEMHGGTIAARSRGRGLGSSFIVRLPLTSTGTKTTSMRGGIVSIMQAPEARGPHILLVDDNDAAAGSMGRLLELQGCRITYAYNGVDAVNQALRLSPDIVLLDVGLPDMNGYEVAKMLRTRGFTGKLVALSGYSTDEAKTLGKDAGFDRYLVKPAGLAEIRVVLADFS